MMGSSDDLISELPESILHLILDCLSFEESARTSVLSKHWYSTWKSFPVLCFDQDDRMKRILKDVPDYQDRVDDFLSFVDTSMRTFVQSGLAVHVFYVNLDGVHVDSIPLIDAWFPFALRNGARVLSIQIFFNSAHQKIAYPISETTFSINSNGGTSKFSNLIYLNLFEVVLSDKIIRDITQNCPNMRELDLFHICGIKNMEISKLHKLERLSIAILEHCPEIERVYVNAPSLHSFSLECQLPCVLDLSLCLALKYLTLDSINITDDILIQHISRFSLLESLKINLCSQLRSIKISHPRLKLLEIRHCVSVNSIDLIDAPSLLKFTYMSSNEKFPRLSSNCNIFKVDFTCNLQVPGDVVLDNAWFIDLRRFLGGLNMRTYLTISFYCNEVNFDSKVLGEDGDHPLVEVDHLDLERLEDMDEARSNIFLEGLLWSCHPKVISFSTNNVIENCLQKVLCDKLFRCGDGSCCNGNHKKCWHHGLKAAEIDFSGDLSSSDQINESGFDEFYLTIDQLSSYQKNKNARFYMEWDEGTTPVINKVTEHVKDSDTALMIDEITNTVIDSRPTRKRKVENLLPI